MKMNDENKGTQRDLKGLYTRSATAYRSAGYPCGEAATVPTPKKYRRHLPNGSIALITDRAILASVSPNSRVAAGPLCISARGGRGISYPRVRPGIRILSLPGYPGFLTQQQFPDVLLVIRLGFFHDFRGRGSRADMPTTIYTI